MKIFGLWLLGCVSFVLSMAAADEGVFNQLDVVPTGFVLTLNDYPLEVARQGIALRTVVEEVPVHPAEDEGQLLPLAYQAHHLEFAFRQRFNVPDGFQVMEFYEGNDLIHSISLRESGRKLRPSVTRRHETNFLSISLRGMPLVMLDFVDRINFRRAN